MTTLENTTTAVDLPISIQKDAASDMMGFTKAAATAPSTVQSRSDAHAARAVSRELRLRAHPHADVHGPELVACRLCGQLIKLSTKSAYDAFHWNKHIERCARRAPAAREQRVIRAAERKRRSNIMKEIEQHPEKRSMLSIRLRGKGSAESSSASEPAPAAEPVDASMPVKEETLEGEIDGLAPSSPRSRSSPLLETPSPPPRPPLRLVPEMDHMMEDYYRRSRRRGTHELSPFTLEAASAWTWSQVKEPVWVVRSYPSSESQDDGNSLNGERNEEAEGTVLESCVSDVWSSGSKNVGAGEQENEAPAGNDGSRAELSLPSS